MDVSGFVIKFVAGYLSSIDTHKDSTGRKVKYSFNLDIKKSIMFPTKWIAEGVIEYIEAEKYAKIIPLDMNGDIIEKEIEERYYIASSKDYVNDFLIKVDDKGMRIETVSVILWEQSKILFSSRKIAEYVLDTLNDPDYKIHVVHNEKIEQVEED